MSRKPPRKQKNSMIKKDISTITYIRNGKETTITINKLNDNIIYQRLNKYISSNQISSIYFKNYNFTDNNKEFSFSKNIEVTLDNCTLNNLEYRNIKSLTIINPKSLKDINIELEYINNINIDLNDSKNNINIKIIGSDNLTITSSKNIENIKLNLNFIKEVYLENITNLNEPSFSKIDELFLKNTSFTIPTNGYFQITQLLELNNSTINLDDPLKLKANNKIKLKDNSSIKCKDYIEIPNITSIEFYDSNDETILDTSSYIEAKEIRIGNYYSLNKSNQKVILDQNKLKELMSNTTYIKNGISYKCYLPEKPTTINQENDIFYIEDNKLILKKDIELIHIKDCEFACTKIELNKEQIIILENCAFHDTLITNGNIEIQNPTNYFNSSYQNFITIINANDAIISLKESSFDFYISVEDTKNFYLKSSHALQGLYLSNVKKVHLKNISSGINCLNCEELTIEDSNDIELENPEYELGKIKQLIIKNSQIGNYSNHLFCIETLKYLYLEKSKIFSAMPIILPNLKELSINKSIIKSGRKISFPNLHTITTNDKLKGISYFENRDEITIGETTLLPPKINFYDKTEIISNNFESDIKRFILFKLLTELKNKITNEIDKSVSEEEQQLLNEIDLYEQEVLKELASKRTQVKTKALTKKEEQKNTKIIDLNIK